MAMTPSASPGRGETEAALFQAGEFQLHSGERSTFKIDCDRLSGRDFVALSNMLIDRMAPFSRVEGVPRGGLRWAECLQIGGYCSEDADDPLLIVDDVLTTGASMEAQRAGRKAIGAVIFARGPVPSWVVPLFRLTDPVVAGGGDHAPGTDNACLKCGKDGPVVGVTMTVGPFCRDCWNAIQAVEQWLHDDLVKQLDAAEAQLALSRSPAPSLEGVQRLVTEWREKAASIQKKAWDHVDDEALAIEMCADDLSTALASLSDVGPQQPLPPPHSGGTR